MVQGAVIAPIQNLTSDFVVNTNLKQQENIMKHIRTDYNRIQDPAGLIPEDEPVFLIRAQDVNAPKTLEAWAESNDMIGGDQQLSSAVRRQAHKMREWQLSMAVKIPDCDFNDIDFS